MKRISNSLISLMIFTLVLGSCASRTPVPVVRPVAQIDPQEPIPDGALSLAQALTKEPAALLTYLKEHSSAQAFECSKHQGQDCLPPDFRAEIRRTKQEPDSDPRLRKYLRQYKKQSTAKRIQSAEKLRTDFTCDKAPESYAVALMLERDFPEASAIEHAQALHDQVQTCESSFRRESLIRQSVLQIYAGSCEKALPLIEKAQAADPSLSQDRLFYLREKCLQKHEAAGYPWNGYFTESRPEARTSASLAEVGLVTFPVPEPNWYLSASSEIQNWDRYLMTLVKALENQNDAQFKNLVKDLNFEAIKVLPRPYLTSLLMLMHLAEQDLPVFRSLHPLLFHNPGLVSRDILALLFPKRHWAVIQQGAGPLDPILVKSVIRQESAFNPEARSRAKAFGLMQLIFPTAKRFGVKKRLDLMMPEQNVRAGSQFLNKLVQDFGSVELALAAYNAGPLSVREWQRRYPTQDLDLFVELIPYKETREYVRLVMRNFRMYKTLLVAPIEPQLAGTVNH